MVKNIYFVKATTQQSIVKSKRRKEGEREKGTNLFWSVNKRWPNMLLHPADRPSATLRVAAAEHDVKCSKISTQQREKIFSLL